jgi:adenylate cyclase
MIRDAIQKYRAAGNGLEQVWFHAILAETEWKAGEWTNAFGTLASAMTLAETNGEGMFEPELYRLEGEFLFEQVVSAGGPGAGGAEARLAQLAQAERSVRKSMDLARRQEARMLELRGLVNLCRIRRELGDASGQHALAEAYHSFTEGFQTPELREALALLESF